MSYPLFKGLTRPASFIGLPLTYVGILLVIVAGGFVLFQSFLYLVISGAICYSLLRLIANYDPRLFDVTFTIIQATPFTFSQLKGKKEVTYGP